MKHIKNIFSIYELNNILIIGYISNLWKYYFLKWLKKDFFISYERAAPVINYIESNSFASINIRESKKER